MQQSSGTQMTPVQQKLRKLQNRLSQCPSGARLCLCTSVASVLTSHSWSNTCPSMKQSRLFLLSLCASRITIFLPLTVPKSHAGIVSVVWIDEVKSSPSFGFSFAHSCFSRFWAALPIFVHTSGYTQSGLVVVWIFVSLLPDHRYPFGGFLLNRVNFVNHLQESDKCLLESTFQ